MHIKYIYLLLILFFKSVLFTQTLSPFTDVNGTHFFYSNLKVTKVSVAGTFNNWDKNVNEMTFDSLKQIWSVCIKIPLGVYYHYKFVLNDTLWITDPNAPNVTEDEWRNGIIIADYNRYFTCSDINPAPNKRITKLEPFSIKLEILDPTFRITDLIVLLDNIEIKNYSVREDRKIFFSPPANLEEGEHTIKLKYKTSNEILFTSKFFLDRFKSKLITPKFYNSAIIYEIFLRKFVSDTMYSNKFIKLIEKLDYLKDLGVDCIWLMPVNEGPTEHGYNVTDYYQIESDYGSLSDFVELIKECKKRKIKVLFDWVINHSDSDHPFFKNAVNNPKSKYSKWYQFTDSSNSNWRHFGIEKNMPKFNFENTEVRQYFISNIKFLMDPNSDGKFDDGIDGVRCDAAKEIPHTFWNELRKVTKKINPRFLLLAEVWDNSEFLIPFFEDEFDMCFNYPLYYAIEDAFLKNNSVSIMKIIEKQKNIFPDNFQMVTFLSNHDNHRALSFFDSDTLKYLQSLALIFTLPGTPMIYYGDEIGLKGKTPPENVRQKMDWKIVKSNQSPFLDIYKKFISLRKKYKSLTTPYSGNSQSLKFLKTVNQNLIAFLRKEKNENILVLLNNSSENITLENELKENNDYLSGEILLSTSKLISKENSCSKIDLKGLTLTPKEFFIIKILSPK